MDANLTDRQLEVVMHLANGLRNEEIADEMGLSESTIKQTIAKAKRRSGARTMPHLVGIAIASGELFWSEDDSSHHINGKE